MWSALTVEDIQSGLSQPELDALSGVGLAEGQADPLPTVIALVTDEIRGYIAANGRNTLGPAGTIPPQVRSAACAMVIWRYAGRLANGKAGELLRSETRKQDYEDAQKLLRDASQDRFSIEQPDDTGPETMTASGAEFGSDEKVEF